MNNSQKSIRWKQRFQNFEKAYQLLEKTLKIENLSEIEKTVVFGSRAKGNYNKGSDVDLAIFGKGINRETIVKLSKKLNSNSFLPYFFDVLQYETINNNDLKEHIDRIGKIIFEAKN